jgi:hypothetical protein
MTAAAYDIQLEQGEDWKPVWSLLSGGQPYNLTGFSAHMQIRSTFYAGTALVDLHSNTGGIVLGGTAGTVQPILTAAASAALSSGQVALPYVLNGRAVFKLGTYDLKITDGGGQVTTLVGGNVWMSPQVTVGGS